MCWPQLCRAAFFNLVFHWRVDANRAELAGEDDDAQCPEPGALVVSIMLCDATSARVVLCAAVHHTHQKQHQVRSRLEHLAMTASLTLQTRHQKTQKKMEWNQTPCHAQQVEHKIRPVCQFFESTSTTHTTSASVLVQPIIQFKFMITWGAHGGGWPAQASWEVGVHHLVEIEGRHTRAHKVA